MTEREYLLSYGTMGDLARASAGFDCARGDEMVLRSPRGLELGVVLCASGPGHVRLLSSVGCGEVVRHATPEDGHTAERMRRRGEHLFADARQTAAQLGLPLEILDVEVLLDGRHAILHHLRAGACDPRELMDRLAERHGLLVSFRDLALPPDVAPTEEEHAHEGCGAEGCGSGGCGTCSSGKCATCSSQRTPSPTPASLTPDLHGRVPVFST
jgi:hypothetical protein